MVDGGDCEECEAGKTSLMGAVECVATIADTADHAWDFRGCADGVPVVDAPEASDLQATLMNGASCTADGVAFDGVDGYVDLDDWEWGGAFTIEMYVKHESFNWDSRVLSIGSGPNSDGVSINNKESTPRLDFCVTRDTDKWMGANDVFEIRSWAHVVVTVSGASAKIYKNGELVKEKAEFHEPAVLTRTQNWLGRSQWSGIPYFHGSIAFVRMWQGVGLQEGDVAELASLAGN